MRGNRPNVRPAKYIPMIDKVETVQSWNRRTDGKRRKEVSDVCDKCHSYIMVPKNIMGLRLQGWRFFCFKCTNEHFKGRSRDLKEEKIWTTEDLAHYKSRFEKMQKGREEWNKTQTFMKEENKKKAPATKVIPETIEQIVDTEVDKILEEWRNNQLAQEELKQLIKQQL